MIMLRGLLAARPLRLVALCALVTGCASRVPLTSAPPPPPPVAARLRGKVFHGFNTQRVQCTFGNFADAGNLAYGERREKTRFASLHYPQ